MGAEMMKNPDAMARTLFSLADPEAGVSAMKTE